jgi:single-strand DNA-binding protein
MWGALRSAPLRRRIFAPNASAGPLSVHSGAVPTGLSTGGAAERASAFLVRDCGTGDGVKPFLPPGACPGAGVTQTGRIEMINDAQVFLSGYIATDPKFDRLNGKTPVARMRIGFTARRVNRETGEWSDGPTSFLTVQCWRKLAENVAVCLRKGEPVLVKGRLQVRKYQANDGSDRLAVEVDASSIGHDLTRGVAHFSRTHRAVGGTASEGEASPDASARDMAGEAGLGEPPGSIGEPGEAPDGGTVLDERAVAEFAEELSDSLSGDHAGTERAGMTN